MGASIREVGEKIKHFNPSTLHHFVYGLIIITVGLTSFGLGRLSAQQEQVPAVKVLYDNTLNTQPTLNLNGTVVASKKGSKYHYPWCSGAQTMNEKNKIWFDSTADAQAAGYTPAGNCKGLE